MQYQENHARIGNFLSELGWAYKAVSDNQISARYESHFGPTEVRFSFEMGRLTMAIHPLLQQPKEGWGHLVDKLIAYLCEQNKLIQVGKDNRGDIYMQIQLPKAVVNFEQFTFVLFNLCHVYEELTIPILQVHAFEGSTLAI